MRQTCLLIALVVAGCPKEEKKSEPEKSVEQPEKKTDKKPKKDDDEPEAKDDKKKDKEAEKPKKATGPHALAGVDVPEWSPPKASTTKCSIAKGDQKKLDALKGGDDDGAGFDDGKGDIEPIIDGYKKTCGSARAAVSQALNAGGYTRYSKKEYAKADGWFARALLADPTNTFARYNLACNLALEGNTEQALWNLEQLVPAAKAGDPRARHYLRKARSDADLKSVKKEARFTKAVDSVGEGPDMSCLANQVHFKDSCVQVCSSYGGQGGCPAGQACSGADHFGDGLVPYCADALKCKEGDTMIEIKDGEVWPAPNAKAGCFVTCLEDSECSGGKKCTGAAAYPSPYGFMIYKACK